MFAIDSGQHVSKKLWKGLYSDCTDISYIHTYPPVDTWYACFDLILSWQRAFGTNMLSFCNRYIWKCSISNIIIFCLIFSILLYSDWSVRHCPGEILVYSHPGYQMSEGKINFSCQRTWPQASDLLCSKFYNIVSCMRWSFIFKGKQLHPFLHNSLHSAWCRLEFSL